jgi:outer membrane protein assembly factor BamB
VIYQGRIYAMQPGGWSLECADARSGQLLWRQVLPELRRLLGVAGGRLLVATAAEIGALDPASGKVLWSHAAGPGGAITLCGAEGSIVVFDVEPASGATAAQPKLAWLDGATGAVIHASPLRLPPAQAMESGPLVLGAGRCWGFFAAEPNSFVREIVELTRGQ